MFAAREVVSSKAFADLEPPSLVANPILDGSAFVGSTPRNAKYDLHFKLACSPGLGEWQAVNHLSRTFCVEYGRLGKYSKSRPPSSLALKFRWVGTFPVRNSPWAACSIFSLSTTDPKVSTDLSSPDPLGREDGAETIDRFPLTSSFPQLPSHCRNRPSVSGGIQATAKHPDQLSSAACDH